MSCRIHLFFFNFKAGVNHLIMKKTEHGYTRRIVNILNILKSNQDDAQVFKKILEQIMETYRFIDKSSFWLVKNDGEHYITGIGYEDEEYAKIVIPLEDSLSATDPEEDVKIINSGCFPKVFPEELKATFIKAGIKENVSKTLQLR